MYALLLYIALFCQTQLAYNIKYIHLKSQKTIGNTILY